MDMSWLEIRMYFSGLKLSGFKVGDIVKFFGRTYRAPLRSLGVLRRTAPPDTSFLGICRGSLRR